MAAKSKGGEQSPSITEIPEKKWNLGNIGPLPYPWPPLMDWVEAHCERGRPDFDIEILIGELNFIAHQIRIERTRAKKRTHPKHAELLGGLTKVRAAIKDIKEKLPALIKSAEMSLSRPTIENEVLENSKIKELLEQSFTQSAQALKLEKSLLAICLEMEVKGFYSASFVGRRPEPWAEKASWLFFWLSRAFEKAGIKPPKQSAVSSRTPFVGIIRDALIWAGYGDRELATIAQSLKRNHSLYIPPNFDGPLFRAALVEDALMRTNRK